MKLNLLCSSKARNGVFVSRRCSFSSTAGKLRAPSPPLATKTHRNVWNCLHVDFVPGHVFYMEKSVDSLYATRTDCVSFRRGEERRKTLRHVFGDVFGPFRGMKNLVARRTSFPKPDGNNLQRRVPFLHFFFQASASHFPPPPVFFFLFLSLLI